MYVLTKDKQVTVVSALAEGQSIHSIERMSSVHRDTIMRLGVHVGEGCARLLDDRLRNLECRYLELDEIWGFITKKQKQVREGEDPPEFGDVWTFVALDAETKIVPCHRVGKRTSENANAFLVDLAGRMRNRVQVSTDALSAYVDAVELGFGGEVDYAQIVKSYATTEAEYTERKYSPPEVAHVTRTPISGSPDPTHVCTSFVERQNLTMRMHCRRLTRLTNAFSKKLKNFKAAVALHFAYYNFVRSHRTLRMTPAMAAGVARDFLTVDDLLRLTA